MNAPTLAVFGAGSGAGFEIAAAARHAGWRVVAVLRPDRNAAAVADMGCVVARADAADPQAVAEVFSDLPADILVASTLGGRHGEGVIDDLGNRTVIDAATARGTRRFLLISSLGAGDSRQHASPRLLAAIGDVLSAKSRAEEHLRASGLAHCIIRPGGLVNGPASGRGRLQDAMDVHGFITRGELAALALMALVDEQRRDRTWSAIDPSCPPPPPRSG